MRKLNVAVIGAGRMGKIRAAAAEQYGAVVTAVCDADLAAAQALADELPSCRALPTPEELDWRRLDAVFVCTPPIARGPVELTAIDHGVAFLVEKPVGLSAERCRPIVQALQSSPVVTAVGYMNRYRPSVQQARQAIRESRVLGASSHWVCGMYRVAWWGDRQQSGGPINEQTTHLVDLSRYLLGEIVEVQAAGHPNPQTGLVTTASINLTFENGAQNSIFYSCESSTKWIGLEIYTVDRCIALDGWDFRLREDVEGEPSETADADRNAVFQHEVDAFLTAVETRRQSAVLSSFEDGVATQAAIDVIHRALASGMTERIRPATLSLRAA